VIFGKKDRAVLQAIAAQLDYQQKLLESILETFDQGQKQALKRKLNMREYFDTVRATLGNFGGDPDSPMMQPFNKILEKLKNE
jgi:hypothetical protein